MRKLLLTIISLSVISLAGCSHFGIYRPDVEQGNVFTTQQVAKLHKGLTKQETQAIMGEPVIIDTFDHSRWTYVHTYQHDGGTIYKKSVTIYFRKGRIARIEKNIPVHSHHPAAS